MTCVGCGGPKDFTLSGFTLHEVRETAGAETITKSMGEETLHLVKVPLISEPLATAIAVENAEHGPVVHLALQDKAKLHEVTEKMLGKRIALVVEERVLTAPVVREAIKGGKISITGNFSVEEAEKIVSTLNPSESVPK